MTYHAAMNSTINGEIHHYFGNAKQQVKRRKPRTESKLARMKKLVRYLSRSIHGI